MMKMNKILLMTCLSLGLMVLTATSSQATDLTLNGWLGTKTAYSQRVGLGQIYPVDDMTNYKYTHMRGRLRFELLPNENSGFVWQNEIDFDYGNSAFENGRGIGGGIGTDTTNLETKNLYFHFNVPEVRLNFLIGIAPILDDFNGVVLSTDTAGFTLNCWDSVRLGSYRFWDQSTATVNDNVDFYMLSVKHELSASSKGGLTLYWLKDGGGNGSGALNQSAGGADTRDIDGLANLSNNAGTGHNALIPGQDYDLKSYFLGFFWETDISASLSLDGWGLYNFGTIKVQGGDDIDISGMALDIHMEKDFEMMSLALDGLYVSGSNKDTDEKFGFTNAGLYGVGANFFARHGMMILLPDGNDWNYSSAYVYNVSNVYENRFLGVTGLFGNVHMTLPHHLGAKVGLGTMFSPEKREVNGNRYMGTEINGELSYKILENVTMAYRLAYALTGDFYEVSAAEAAASLTTVQANTDPDDVFYNYLELKMVF